MTPVAIVGAGPVGLSLALGLARRGVRSVVLERNDGISDTSKAPGIHVRTREILRQWDVEERFVREGLLRRRLDFVAVDGQDRHLLTYDFHELDGEADLPGILIIEQGHTEELLLQAVRESGLCDVRFGAEVSGLTPGSDGVLLDVQASGEEFTVGAEFAVGCDGASSFVREALGLPFDGITYSLGARVADISLDDGRNDLPWPRLDMEREGVTAGLRLESGLWRLIRIEPGQADEVDGSDVEHDEVAPLVAGVLGEGPFELEWGSRFRFHRRSAPRLRVGRVLLAGDAANVHPPIGGQGMNAGIGDANNLAWKLTAALRGGDVDALLDSYDLERRQVVVGSVSRYTDVLTRVLLQAPPGVRAGGLAVLRACLTVPPLRRAALRRLTMIDLGYGDSPLLDGDDRGAGARLPNVELRAPSGDRVRLHDLLDGQAVVIDVAERRPHAPELPVGRVVRIGPGGHSDQSGKLRDLLGGSDGWILVRPDTHVAWAGDDLVALRDRVRRALGGAPASAFDPAQALATTGS